MAHVTCTCDIVLWSTRSKQISERLLCLCFWAHEASATHQLLCGLWGLWELGRIVARQLLRQGNEAKQLCHVLEATAKLSNLISIISIPIQFPFEFFHFNSFSFSKKTQSFRITLSSLLWSNCFSASAASSRRPNSNKALARLEKQEKSRKPTAWCFADSKCFLSVNQEFQFRRWPGFMERFGSIAGQCWACIALWGGWAPRAKSLRHRPVLQTWRVENEMNHKIHGHDPVLKYTLIEFDS